MATFVLIPGAGGAARRARGRHRRGDDPARRAVGDAVREALAGRRLAGRPTRFLQARGDRFFPVEFQRRVVGERLGIAIDEMSGGHLVALGHPVELADRLVGYL